MSHHPYPTKLETAKNFYKTANICSSNNDYVEASYQKIDNLLRCNGYSNPRSMITQRIPKPQGHPSSTRLVCLKLPFISDELSYSIKRFVVTNNLPIRLIFIPGRKLQDIFCSSRPYDKRKCTISNCIICPLIVNNNPNCAVKNPVYKVTCNLCTQFYIGESSREARDST